MHVVSVYIGCAENRLMMVMILQLSSPAGSVNCICLSLTPEALFVLIIADSLGTMLISNIMSCSLVAMDNCVCVAALGILTAFL